MPSGSVCCSTAKPPSATIGGCGHGCATPGCVTRLRSKTSITVPPAGSTVVCVLTHDAKFDVPATGTIPFWLRDHIALDYRGSIVHLAPATTYEIELTLTGTVMGSGSLTKSGPGNVQLQAQYDQENPAALRRLAPS